MTIAEALVLFLRANLVASVAIAVVLLLRKPVRRAFGAHIAYGLWPIALFAVAGALMPLLQEPNYYETGLLAGLPQTRDTGPAVAWLQAQGRDRIVLAAWLIGVAVSGVWAAISLARFMRAERAGRAGPAVVGVVVPRLVAPADAAERFTPEEWRLVRAHERAHMDRQDARGAAVAVLAQWLCWFNPLVHMALLAVRLDQELACDATVLERLPVQRRRYAETLLRTQLDHGPTYGIAWRGCGALETRLAMLATRQPPLDRLDLGEIAVNGLWIAAFVGGIAAQALV